MHSSGSRALFFMNMAPAPELLVFMAPAPKPVAYPAQKLGGCEMFDFRRITLFYLEFKAQNDYIF